MKMEVTITPNDLETLIIEHLSEKFEEVGPVIFDVQMVEIGSQMQAYKKPVLKGIKCEVKL